MKKNITVVFSVLFLFLFSSILFSYPKFSAYTGSNCSDCHVNPTGGGMRNLYGQKYAKDNLYMDAFKKISDANDFSGKLTKNILIGGDVRMVYANNENKNAANSNTFFTMQGDLYVNAQINDYLNVYISPGIYLPNNPTKYEVYGMVSRLPLNAYLKAGRMNPNFGIRIPEHRAYQRQELLNTPYSADNGLEIGISPYIFNFNIGLFNGLNSGSQDIDQNKMFVASGDILLNMMDEKLNLNLGGSFYNNPYNYYDPVISGNVNANKKAWCGFTRIGIYDRVALLGEYDFAETSTLNLVRSVYRYLEMNARIVNGIEMRISYEFKDVNRDIGNDEISRYSIGAAVFPMLGFETEAALRFLHSESIKTKEFQWNFHFYF